MVANQTFPQEIDTTLIAPMTKDHDVGGWTVIVMPDSGTFFGTRKPVKVGGTIDGHPFEATLLPKGDGTHIIPIKAALRKTIAKEHGTDVTIHLQRRFT